MTPVSDARLRLWKFWQAAIVASLVAGLVAGLLARFAMAVLAAEGGSSMTATVGQLTLGGTVRILIIPMLFGIPFSALLLRIGRLWSGALVIIRAAAYGIAFLIFPGSLLLTDSEFHIAGANRTLGPLLFAPIYATFGVLVGLIGERLLQRPTTEASGDPADHGEHSRT